jgi:ABC-type uncharacterized transport system YnjBCD ATPase subunit
MGCSGSLDKHLARAAVVVHIVGHQHARVAMLRTALQHPDLAVLENNLRVNAAVTGGADGDGHVIKEIRAKLIGH